MKKITFLLILSFCCSTAFSQWERTTGPEGSSIEFLTNIDGKIYAGTNGDGVFQSTNAGSNWIPLNTGMEYENVRSVVLKSGDLFAGSFQNGVFKSTNGGESWIPPAPENRFKVYDLLVKDNYIFAGSQGLYRSSDNGNTWELSPYIFQFAQTSICSSGENIFVASYGDMEKSTDNGDTFTKQFQFESQAIFSLYSLDSMVFVGSSNKIYRSVDHGENFEQINIPFPFSIVNIYDFAYVGSTLFIGTSYNGVYKSTDNGETWSPVITGMGPKDVRALTIIGTTLIAGTHYSGMYSSENQGTAWDRLNDGLPAASTIDELIADGSIVYAGTRDGVYRTLDNGRGWNKLAGESDTINYGTISGLCVKDGFLFACARYHFNTTVFRWSENKWKRMDSGLPDNMFIFGITSSGPNVLAGTDHGIYYSPNNGEYWQLANAPENFAAQDITGAGNGYVYAIWTSGGIYKSIDDGVNWSLSLELSNFIDLSAKDNYAYASGFDLGVFKTSDFGNSWANSLGFGGSTVFGVELIGDGLVLAATEFEGSRILLSNDYGTSFTPYSEGLGPNALAENFAVTDSFMFAGMDFNGVWRRLRPGLTSINSNTNSPDKFSLSQNFPNPFNPETKIRFSLPGQSHVTLSVYDALGRKLITLVDGIKDAGNYDVNFNGSAYSSGIYFYRITTGDYSETRKMQLIK